jgi:hypothetical protein
MIRALIEQLIEQLIGSEWKREPGSVWMMDFKLRKNRWFEYQEWRYLSIFRGKKFRGVARTYPNYPDERP